MDNLDDFLKGENEAPEPEAEAPETPETEAEAPQPEAEAEAPEVEAKDEGRPRDEKGRFIPKGEKEEASPPEAEERIPVKALQEERRKRQELEAQLMQMQQHLQQPPQQQQAPQGPPDRWEDPEGYDQWLVTQAAHAARAEAYQQFQYQRLAESGNRLRQSTPDYEEKIQVFGQMANANPSLLAQLVQAENPAEFAYNLGKQQIEIAQYGGIDGLIQAKVQEALSKAQPAPVEQKPSLSIPETLADAQSARGSESAAFNPTPLESILGMARAATP